MFESLQERQKSSGRHWGRALGITSAVITIVLLLVRWGMREDSERRHETYRAAIANDPALHPEKRTYEPTTFFGMSIDVPGYASKKGRYGEGSLSGTSPLEFAITWYPGAFPAAERREVLLDAMKSSVRTEARITGDLERVDSKDLVVGGTPGYQATYRASTLQMTVTFAECGGRVVVILVGGSIGVRETSDRMVESFRCKPDPTQDLYRSDVVVDVQPGWKRFKPTGDLMLVNANDVRVRPASFEAHGTGSVSDHVLEMFRPSGYSLNQPASTIGDKVFWYGALYDQGANPVRVAVLAWRCDHDRRIATLVVSSPSDPTGKTLAEGIELAKTGRCLGADERSPVYPSSFGED